MLLGRIHIRRCMVNKRKRRHNRGRYRKESLKWAARYHNHYVRIKDEDLDLKGVAYAVIKYGRGLLEIQDASTEVLDRLAGRESKTFPLIEYRDKGVISLAKAEVVLNPAPAPPELQRLVSFWEIEKPKEWRP